MYIVTYVYQINKKYLTEIQVAGSLIQESLFSFTAILCVLVVRVPGYRSRGLGLDSRRYQFFWEVVGLERGPLGLVSITEELLE
jgi:hypothetical protein